MTIPNGRSNPFVMPYSEARQYIQTGDLLSWRSSSFIGAGIRFVTGEYVNHSSICTDIKEYGRERKFCLEALEGGIELHSISRRLEQFKGEVYWHGLKPKFWEYRTALGIAAFNRIGIDYDYTSIIKQLFGRVSLDTKRLFCSEFVYQDFVDAKVPGADPDAIAPNPGELFRIHQFWGMPVLIN